LEKKERELSERKKHAENRLKELEARKKEREKSILLANQRYRPSNAGFRWCATQKLSRTSTASASLNSLCFPKSKRRKLG